jgi:hypothetical protein
LNEQAENIETIILGESGQRRDGILFFYISTNIEMFMWRQPKFQRSLKRCLVQKAVGRTGLIETIVATESGGSYGIGDAIRRSAFAFVGYDLGSPPHLNAALHTMTIRQQGFSCFHTAVPMLILVAHDLEEEVFGFAILGNVHHPRLVVRSR